MDGTPRRAPRTSTQWIRNFKRPSCAFSALRLWRVAISTAITSNILIECTNILMECTIQFLLNNRPTKRPVRDLRFVRTVRLARDRCATVEQRGPQGASTFGTGPV
jgi:hypothetical protein